MRRTDQRGGCSTVLLVVVGVLVAFYSPFDVVAHATDSTAVSDDSTKVGMTHAPHRHLGLSGWLNQNRLMIMDQKHNVGGYLYDRGIFHRFDRQVYREYEMDRLLYEYSLDEADAWENQSSGFRLWGGSVLRYEFGYGSQIKYRWDEKKNIYSVRATLQSDLHARRGLIELGYKRKLGEHHFLGAKHTIAEHKPDLNITTLYEYRGPYFENITLSATFLNIYNNIIYKMLGVWKGYKDIVRDYSVAPRLYEIDLETSEHYPFQLEVSGGFQTYSRVHYYSQSNTDYHFHERNKLNYLGVMADYNIHPFVVGVYFQHKYSWLSREGRGSAIQADYSTHQHLDVLGGMVSVRHRNFDVSARYQWESYEDMQQGQNFDISVINSPLDYEEQMHKLIVNGGYDFPRSNFRADIFYVFTKRNILPEVPDSQRRQRASPLFTDWIKSGTFRLNPNNYRLAFQIGYDFGRGSVELGAGYDIDRDSEVSDMPRRFDGGFGRIIVDF